MSSSPSQEDSSQRANRSKANGITNQEQYKAKETNQPVKGIRSRAAKLAVQEASEILAKQSQWKRQQSKVVFRTELFFALLSAGLAYNLWKTRVEYNEWKERTQLEMIRVEQERDAVLHQLAPIRQSLQQQVEPVAQDLFEIANNNNNNHETINAKRREVLYQWLSNAIDR